MDDDGGLEALARYISSGDPAPASSPLPTAPETASESSTTPRRDHHHHRSPVSAPHERQRQDSQDRQMRKGKHRRRAASSADNGDLAIELFGEESPHRNATHDATNTKSSNNSSHHSSGIMQDGRLVEQSGNCNGASTPLHGAAALSTTAAAGCAAAAAIAPPDALAPGILAAVTPNSMPEPRLREYSLRWLLPEALGFQGEDMGGEGGEDSDGRVGARLYARVMGGEGGGCGGLGDGAVDEGGDGGADVRLAVSIAEPMSAIWQ